MSEIKQAEAEARKPSVLAPVMGLMLAVALAVIAYFVAPFALEPLRENAENIDKMIVEAEDPEATEQNLRYAMSAFIWFVSFALLMMFVAGVAGRDSLIAAERKTLQPRSSELNAREAQKYYDKISKQRRQKIEALKRLKAKEEAKRKRGES